MITIEYPMTLEKYYRQHQDVFFGLLDRAYEGDEQAIHNLGQMMPHGNDTILLNLYRNRNVAPTEDSGTVPDIADYMPNDDEAAFLTLSQDDWYIWEETKERIQWNKSSIAYTRMMAANPSAYQAIWDANILKTIDKLRAYPSEYHEDNQ